MKVLAIGMALVLAAACSEDRSDSLVRSKGAGDPRGGGDALGQGPVRQVGTGVDGTGNGGSTGGASSSGTPVDGASAGPAPLDPANPPFTLAARPASDRLVDTFIPFSADSELVLADITRQRVVRPDDIPFLRYISFTHLDYIDFPDSGKFVQFKADMINSLSVIMNSLSSSDFVVKPLPLNKEMSVFRIDLRDYNWSAQQWDRVMAANRNDPDKDAYPYLNTFDPTVVQLAGILNTTVPIVRADWLVTEITKPGTYYDLLNLRSLAQLDASLGVDRIANVQRTIDQPTGPARALRVGIGPGNSGVSINNRVIERHESGQGIYWISYDFAEVPGNLAKSIFSSPIGPSPVVDRSVNPIQSFNPDGGEVIFSLPNGLFGYALADAEGNLLNEAPTNIVFNTLDRADQGVISNGLPCMECHTKGLLVAKDEVRPFMLAADDELFSDFIIDGTLALYPEQAQSERVIKDDNVDYTAATLQSAFWGELERGFTQGVVYYEGDMSLSMMASELNITVAQFERIRPRLSLELRNLLSPVDINKLNREDFEGFFARLLQEIFTLRDPGLPLSPGSSAGSGAVNTGSSGTGSSTAGTSTGGTTGSASTGSSPVETGSSGSATTGTVTTGTGTTGTGTTGTGSTAPTRRDSTRNETRRPISR